MDGILLSILSIVFVVVLTAVGLMVRSTILRLQREVKELRVKTQNLSKRMELADQKMNQQSALPANLLAPLPALLVPVLAKRFKGTKFGLAASAGMIAFRLISSYMQRRGTTRRGQ